MLQSSEWTHKQIYKTTMDGIVNGEDMGKLD